MSFQAYLDNIKAKTGKSPEDFVQLAEEKGFLGADVKAGQILEWLKQDFGLARGHGMAVVMVLQSATRPKVRAGARLAEVFSGRKARWQAPYDSLVAQVRAFGTDVSVGVGGSYMSLLRKGKKFAIVQVTGDRLDVGIKLRDAATGGRLEPAGTWNSMVTHRIRITDPAQVDGDLLADLKRAYDLADTERKAPARA
jgi:hypothetical protein